MHGHVTNPIGLALTAGALTAVNLTGGCSTSSDKVSIDDARTTLLDAPSMIVVARALAESTPALHSLTSTNS